MGLRPPYRIFAFQGHFLSVPCLLPFCSEALELCPQLLQDMRAGGNQGVRTLRLQKKKETLCLVPSSFLKVDFMMLTS